MLKCIKKIIAKIILPNKTIMNWLHPEMALYQDLECLYYTLNHKVARIHHITDETIINSRLLKDLKAYYPNLKYLHHFVNSSDEPTIPELQQAHFVIVLNRKNDLIIEYDSMGRYNIYYDEKYETKELQYLLLLIRKNKVLDFPKHYRHISLN